MKALHDDNGPLAESVSKTIHYILMSVPQPRQLKVYVARNGRVPFIDWFEGLDVTNRNRIRARLNRVRLGNLGDAKAVGGGVKELRMKFGPGYRVYFGEDDGDLVVLLVGGDKGSQTADIAQARTFWTDYLSQEEC